MKSFVVIMLLIISRNGMSQDTAISFINVVDVPEMSKTKIYDKVYLWAIDGFKNVSNAMEAKDKEAGPAF
jgi:Domain of unknown function (DUF4468) with TBP-like fold